MTSYTGTDNLDVMALAANYNAYLAGLILENAHKSQNILDFGAGTGTFAVILQNNGYAVTCIEADSGLCSRLKKLGFVAETDISKLSESQFDFIYSFNVLEHIDDDDSAIRDLHKALRLNGKILVYVPAFNLLFTSMDKKVGHVRRYTRKTLSGLITRAGFQIEKLEYADSLGFLATLAYKMFGSKTGDLNEKSIILFDKVIFPISRLLDRVAKVMFGKNVLVVARKI
jgi:SAM-dependent methyltransferase